MNPRLLFGVLLCLPVIGLLFFPNALAHWSQIRPLLDSPSWVATVWFVLFSFATFIALIALGPNHRLATFPKLLLTVQLSVGATLAAIFYFFPALSTLLPHALQPAVPHPYDVVAQKTKAHALPKSYIAIAGDSYAYGSGNWWGAKNDWRRSPRHTGYFLNRALNTDIVTFARPGRSHIGGFVREPISAWKKLHSSYALEQPKKFLLFLYEGNDWTDNLRELAQLEFEKNYGAFNQDSFGRFLRSELRRQDFVQPATPAFAVPFGFFDQMLARVSTRWAKKAPSPRALAQTDLADGEKTIRRVEQRWGIFPNQFYGPALELDQEQLEQSLLVFSYSVEFLKTYFPQSEIQVVLIPSVLTAYIHNNVISAVIRSQKYQFDPKAISERSDWIARKAKRLCEKLGVGWIDTRRAIQQAAQSQALHGPTDWLHFNHHGFEVFANAIVSPPQKSPSLQAG